MLRVIHPDFPEYFVWEDGTVERAVDSRRYTKAGDIMRGRVLVSGYRQFNLINKDGNRTLIRANRLVCEAFHGPAPSTAHHAAHSDGVKLNNRQENLYWATPKENMADRAKHGTQVKGETAWNQFGRSKLTAAMVAQIRSEYRGERGQVAQLARRFGVSCSGMQNVVSGKTWMHINADPCRARHQA